MKPAIFLAILILAVASSSSHANPSNDELEDINTLAHQDSEKRECIALDAECTKDKKGCCEGRISDVKCQCYRLSVGSPKFVDRYKHERRCWCQRSGSWIEKLGDWVIDKTG